MMPVRRKEKKPTPEYLSSVPAFAMMMGGDPRVEGTPGPKWSNLTIMPPVIGAFVDVRSIWGDGKPLGRAEVVGYLVDSGWLYLAVVPKRRYNSPFQDKIAFVAGIDLKEQQP